MKWIPFLLVGLVLGVQTYSQTSPFQISLEALEINELPGLQSFAWAQNRGRWLLLGGRMDGLHRRQPFAAFDSLGQNRSIVVVSPSERKQWSASLAELPKTAQEQLSGTNLQFHQVGNILYVAGGYGYSESFGDHKTFEYLTAIDVQQAIDAVIGGKSLAPHIRQVSDSLFAVTGGQMEEFGGTFYLVGGQKFTGRYNPQGPNHGPGFSQQYTNQIRKFKIEDDGVEIKITHLPSPVDSLELHRRDFNLVPQIMPHGKEALTAFSGVFQYKADIPWYDCVDINEDGYSPIPQFFQYYNQYHCPRIPIYSGKQNEMHTVFLGGISSYYDDASLLTLDCNVPFVKTISRVTRAADGKMTEYLMPSKMPSFLGASAEFILSPMISHFQKGIVLLDSIGAKRTLIGHIVGGIESQDDNIFWVNEGEHSVATSEVWEVYLTQNLLAHDDRLNARSQSPLQVQILPDPYLGIWKFDFFLTKPGEAKITIMNNKNKKLIVAALSGLEAGAQHWEKEWKQLKKGGIFKVEIKAEGQTELTKVVVEL